jgi:tRNA A37 methylthiotransferase MiaB
MIRALSRTRDLPVFPLTPDPVRDEDDDFKEVLDLLEEIRFERVGAFTYSVEEGTRAAEMDGQIEQAVMNERLEELMEVQREISFEKNLALVGTRTTALVDQLLEDDEDFVALRARSLRRTRSMALPTSSGRRAASSRRDCRTPRPSSLVA